MTSDWMFWIAGGLLGIAGLWLAYWSLLSDRAKGRERCPKCWYDMQGAESLRCPECGHAAKTDRKLLKTRRRWRWAVLSIIVLIGSSLLHLAPQVRTRGWLSIAPNTLLILVLPYDESEVVRSWLLLRLDVEDYGYPPLVRNDLYKWQWRLFASRLAETARRDWKTGNPSKVIRDIDLIPDRVLASEVAAECLPQANTEDRNWLVLRIAVIRSANGTASPACLPALADLVDEQDETLAHLALNSIEAFDSDGVSVLPQLCLIYSNRKERGAPMPSILRSFRHMGPTASAAIPLLAAELEDPDPHTHFSALEGLAGIDFAQAEPFLLEHVHSADVKRVRRALTVLLVLEDQTDRALVVLDELSRHESAAIREVVPHAIVWMKNRAASALAILDQMQEDGSEEVQKAVKWAKSFIGPLQPDSP